MIDEMIALESNNTRTRVPAPKNIWFAVGGCLLLKLTLRQVD